MNKRDAIAIPLIAALVVAVIVTPLHLQATLGSWLTVALSVCISAECYRRRAALGLTVGILVVPPLVTALFIYGCRVGVIITHLPSMVEMFFWTSTLVAFIGSLLTATLLTKKNNRTHFASIAVLLFFPLWTLPAIVNHSSRSPKKVSIGTIDVVRYNQRRCHRNCANEAYIKIDGYYVGTYAHIYADFKNGQRRLPTRGTKVRIEYQVGLLGEPIILHGRRAYSHEQDANEPGM